MTTKTMWRLESVGACVGYHRLSGGCRRHAWVLSGHSRTILTGRHPEGDEFAHGVALSMAAQPSRCCWDSPNQESLGDPPHVFSSACMNSSNGRTPRSLWNFGLTNNETSPSQPREHRRSRFPLACQTQPRG